LLKQIEDERREATPGEKAILVRYTGWGAFSQQMFDNLPEPIAAKEQNLDQAANFGSMSRSICTSRTTSEYSNTPSTPLVSKSVKGVS
jgi:hypothetical protein